MRLTLSFDDIFSVRLRWPSTTHREARKPSVTSTTLRRRPNGLSLVTSKEDSIPKKRDGIVRREKTCQAVKEKNLVLGILRGIFYNGMWHRRTSVFYVGTCCIGIPLYFTSVYVVILHRCTYVFTSVPVAEASSRSGRFS